MEPQTRFNLTTALAGWRQELQAQDALTDEDRRELESHLLDSMEGLRRLGLPEEECFWLARRRLGRPEELHEQFTLADPGKVWRERAYWFVLGLFALQWLGLAGRGILRAAILSIPESWSVYAPTWWAGSWRLFCLETIVFMVTWILPAIAIVLLMRHGRLFAHPRTSDLFYSRWKLSLFGISTVLILAILGLYGSDHFFLNFMMEIGFRMYGLLALLVWLMPKPSRTTAQPAFGG
jgi:hypothetical protein